MLKTLAVSSCLLLAGCATKHIQVAMPAATAEPPHGSAFIFKQVRGDEAILQPMIAPQIGVQLIKGFHEITRNDVLICKQGTEVHKVIANGQEAKVTTQTLTCGERVFAIQAIYFEQQ